MTDKQPEALRLAADAEHFAGWLERRSLPHKEMFAYAAELRRLHEVNTELVEVFKRIRLEQSFACECGIEDSTWELIEAAIAKATGK